MVQCVAVCGSVLQCVSVSLRCFRSWESAFPWAGVLQCVAECCSVLQCVAVCCDLWQRVAACCIVLQCVFYIHTFVVQMNSDLGAFIN